MKDHYQYALDFLNHLNAAVAKDTKLQAWFLRDGYNHWLFYQQEIFEDIQRWRIGGSISSRKKRSLFSYCKGFFTALFLLSVSIFSLVVARIRNSRVLVYSVDRLGGVYGNDPRLGELYDVLNSDRVSFAELIHTVPSNKTWRNAWQRGRPIVYLEASDVWFWVVTIFNSKEKIPIIDLADLACFDVDEKEFARLLLTRYAGFVNRSSFRISFLKNLLRFLRIDKVVAIDNGRHNFTLFAAAKALGISSLALQHGHFTKYHVGWLRHEELAGVTAPADKLLVWSSYWKDELGRLSSYYTSQNIITGIPKAMRGDVSISALPPDLEIMTVLVPYEGTGPQQAMATYIKALLGDSKIRVIFKLRKDVAAEQQLEEYGLGAFSHSRFVVTADVASLLPEVNLVLGVYSTYLYEMVVEGIPVGIVDLGWDYGEGMIINGLASSVPVSAVTYGGLLPFASLSEKERIVRREKLLGTTATTLEKTLREYLTA